MELNARAVAAGFVVTIVIGLLGGLTIPYTAITLPVLGWLLTGFLGGIAAGYIARGTLTDGAVNGGVATVVGSFVVLVIMSLVGVLTAGLFGIGLFVMGVLFLVVAAIPGFVGGAVGRALKGEETEPGVKQPGV